MQTRLGSIVEAAVNTGFGFILSWTMQHYLVPLFFDLKYSAGQSFGITVMFTGLSLVRSYVVRRWFNASR